MAGRKPLPSTINKTTHLEPNVIGIMTGTEWSDQTKKLLFCHIHHQYVWRQNRNAYKEKYLIPTVKYGGGRYFSASGPKALFKITGTMNWNFGRKSACLCWDLVIGRFSSRTLTPNVFQNPHRKFSESNIHVLQWPSPVTILKHIKNLWSISTILRISMIIKVLHRGMVKLYTRWKIKPVNNYHFLTLRFIVFLCICK